MMNVNGFQVSKEIFLSRSYSKFHNSFFFIGPYPTVTLLPHDIPLYPARIYQQPKPHPAIYPPVKRANRRGLRVSAFLPRANNGHADAGHR